MLVCVFWFIGGHTAHAADTTEVLKPEEFYFQFGIGFYGIGFENKDFPRLWTASAVVAYGLDKKISGYISLGGQSNEVFSKGVGSLGFGLFATPLQTKHFAIDALLYAGIGRNSISPMVTTAAQNLTSDFILSPGVEINFNFDEDMNSIGFYIILAEEFRGFEISNADGSKSDVFAPTTRAIIAFYWTVVAKKHELHIQYDMSFRHYNHARKVDVGGIALGYNAKINKNIEIISQIYIDIPQPGEHLAVGLSISLAR